MFIFAAIVVGVIGLVMYGRWWNLHGGGAQRREREERRKAERASGSKARGWQYDGTIDGNIHYRITGKTPGGQPWKIHYDSDQSSSSSTPRLIFHATSLTGDRFEWAIHDRKAYDIMQKSGVRAVVGGLSKLIGAFSDAMKLKRDFYLDATALSTSSSEFRQRYVLAAIDTKWAALLNGEIERLILDWPEFKQSMTLRDNCFSAELTPEGLRVQLYADAPEFDVIAQMARLGESLTDAAARIETGGQPLPSGESTVFPQKLI